MELSRDNHDLLRDLAAKIQSLREEERTVREATHGNFNIFKALEVVGYEIPTSRFIAYLLDPSAGHDCGSDLLNEFLSVVSKIEIDPEDTELRKRLCKAGHLSDSTRCKVRREWKTKEGRSIDIVLEFPDFRIGIENKIEAGEQPNQVRDYADALGDSGLLLYLTKNGSVSTTDEGRPYVRLSYETHIQSWLKKCAESLHSKPRVYENLNQFRDAIAAFLKPNADATITMIAEFISGTPEILKEQVDIVRGLDNAKVIAIRRFFDQLGTELKPFGISIQQRSLVSGNGYLNFSLHLEQFPTVRAYPLTIEQESHALGDEGKATLFLGFRYSLEGIAGGEEERKQLSAFLEFLKSSHQTLVKGEANYWPASWIELHEAPFTPERCTRYLNNDFNETLGTIAQMIREYVQVFTEWMAKNPYPKETQP